MQNDLDKIYRTMLIVWVGITMGLAGLFVFSTFAAPEPSTEPTTMPSGVVLFVLAALATFIMVLSFAVKRKILQRSVEKQDVMLVQQAMVVACAMCELGALFGVVERFVIGSGEHYLLFLISAVGMALHFPRRDQVLAASWNEQSRRSL